MTEPWADNVANASTTGGLENLAEMSDQYLGWTRGGALGRGSGQRGGTVTSYWADSVALARVNLEASAAR